MNPKTKRWIKSSLWALLVVGLCAGLSSLFTDTGSTWYKSLIKPAFMPAPAVFGFVWAGLYLLLAGAVAVLIYQNNRPALGATAALLVLLALWNLTFFQLHNALGGLVLLVLSFAAALYTLNKARPSILPVVAYSLLIIWLVFATVLNYYLVMAN
ncbi:MAG: tryptophan-rich sensory protein [Clostridia bacterium]|nr:tryptophan-rich sensory protein [Clostridia bacterium]